MATHDLRLVTLSDTTMEAPSSAVALSDLATDAETAESPLTAPRTPASFLTLPLELRTEIYRLLHLVPQGDIQVRARHQPSFDGGIIDVRKGFGPYHLDVFCTTESSWREEACTHMRCHLGVSYPYCQRKAPLQPLDALHIMYTNKQLHEEASRSLYASMTVNLQSFWGLRAFKTAIGPMKWSSLTWIELDADFLAVDFSKYSDAWTMLCGIENLSSLSIRVDSDALDIAAVQDAHLRTRFARQLSLPGPREEEDTIDRAKKQLDCLFQIARCLMGQIAETAARCQRIKALSIGRFVGYRAIGRSVSIGLDALQSMDYDEIEASIMPRIERELEEAGCFE